MDRLQGEAFGRVEVECSEGEHFDTVGIGCREGKIVHTVGIVCGEGETAGRVGIGCRRGKHLSVGGNVRGGKIFDKVVKEAGRGIDRHSYGTVRGGGHRACNCDGVEGNI